MLLVGEKGLIQAVFEYQLGILEESYTPIRALVVRREFWVSIMSSFL